MPRPANSPLRHALGGLTTAIVIAALATSAATGTAVARPRGTGISSTGTVSTVPASLPGSVGTIRVATVASPERTVVRDDAGVLATFSRTARTVSLRGPSRTFSEAGLVPVVRHSTWVRELTAPFAGTVDWAWLSAALADRSPDVLAAGLQYAVGAPDEVDASGLRFAGDASYGPLTATGTRAEGSDFNDYLGLTWRYATGSDAPETDQLGDLDCSGFVRMVMGYRGGVPLALNPDGVGLPRRSFEILASGPGVLLQTDIGVRPALPTSLTPGDLVFFDASTDDGTRVDHMGIYLGVDSVGAPRFMSSRKTVDGPTFADVGGRSTLSGTGLYATAFRGVRRI